MLTISTYTILLCYQLFVNGASFAGFVAQLFNVFIFLSLFRTDADELLRLVTFLAKVMAVLLSISIPCFILYLFGFQFPSRSAVFGEYALYSFTNYYFFMIEDSTLFSLIIPRFNSVFWSLGILELLQCYCFWRKWESGKNGIILF